MIVREEIAAALERKQPAKLQYTLDEAAKRLNVKSSLLGGKVRAGEIPHHRAGRRIYFTESDLAQIDQLTAIGPKNGNGNSTEPGKIRVLLYVYFDRVPL